MALLRLGSPGIRAGIGMRNTNDIWGVGELGRSARVRAVSGSLGVSLILFISYLFDPAICLALFMSYHLLDDGVCLARCGHPCRSSFRAETSCPISHSISHSIRGLKMCEIPNIPVRPDRNPCLSSPLLLRDNSLNHHDIASLTVSGTKVERSRKICTFAPLSP